MRRKAEEERTAAARKAELKLELTRKESDAHIAASAAAAAAAATAATAPIHTPRRTGIEDDDIIGEVHPEVINISLCFAGPPPRRHSANLPQHV